MGIESRTGKDGIRRYRARKQHDGRRRRGPWRDSLVAAKRDEVKILEQIEAELRGIDGQRFPRAVRDPESETDDER